MSKFETEYHLLSSIFCSEGEFGVIDEQTFAIRIEDFELVFHVPSEYPTTAPTVSFRTCSLSNVDIKTFYADFSKYAESLISANNSSFYDLIIWCRETLTNVYRSTDKPEVEADNNPSQNIWKTLHRTVLHFDHMRDKPNYIKSLKRLSESMQVNSQLLLSMRTIILIVQGSEDSLKEFKKTLRCVCADVDSSGNKCKERMVTELVQDAITSSTTLLVPSFSIVHLPHRDDLIHHLKSHDLLSILDSLT